MGVRFRRVLLDRGFDSTTMMAALKHQRLPFVLRVVMRGRNPRPGNAGSPVRLK